MSTGLARTTAAPIVITTPDEYATSLAEWEKHYNVLTPFTTMVGIAPSHGLIATIVQLSLDPVKKEVYSGYLENGAKGMPFLKGDRGKPNEEFAIAKIGLRKLAECGSISTDADRLDNGMRRNYWMFKGIGTYRGLDGSIVRRTATAEWDLQDGSDRMRGWKEFQIPEGRKNGLRNAEARAINAAIRECGCGIKQSYTRAELERPFLVVRVAFLPDMNDPDIKRMVTQQALGNTSMLYGGGQQHALSGEVVDAPASGDPVPVGRGSTSGAAAPPKPAEDLPPVEGAVKIASATFRDGETNKRKWRKFIVVDSNGVEYSTFDKQHYDDATRFKTSNTWVEIATEGGQYNNIIEIVKAGSEPNLPGLDEV